ncbi:hypothetical protein EO98_18850 [Methanosarcina sp. 2.H.T.1A.6]|uniref:hypothetical protein n=1 Tax=unclassified Methanosarcina TaxID=2644672 RepID=UPI000621A1C8|nr:MULTISPECIES: hypothetical protein [unclassified Methanosarcina]KKG16994.1 hypothetical protein EO94_18040 [Methanosarcina sp. 2.H.T.1A.3]KKG20382.1 hypothetical protein EO98_18850 [Methanosarcina sp. 2.H.T.1A.6]KKG23353.1 hypothetical protein EO96_17005 [Methanosarcina sp. 2.H.T.1A.8]KKG27755.1 hypothetical protein EO97_00805 [Methanosarcina sp. 2.H.T.1A.15]
MILIIGVLITANAADARPAGTIIKEGVLTYPAGPYLSEDPLLLGLENHGDDKEIQTSDDSVKKSDSEKECLDFYNNCENLISENPAAGNILICSSDLHSIYYDRNKEILQLVWLFFVVLLLPLST